MQNKLSTAILAPLTALEASSILSIKPVYGTIDQKKQALAFGCNNLWKTPKRMNAAGH